jgi:phenylacetate-CoA ligase
MTDHYDDLESRPPAQRESDLLARLPALLARAQSAPGWARILDGVAPETVRTRAALEALPVTRKSALRDLQRGAFPFGGLNATPAPQLARIFMSPGPVYDPSGRSPDWWRFARALHAGGFRRGQLVQNCFSYHFTPAAFMLDSGCAQLGCAVIPAGTGQTAQQVQAMQELRPDAYVGTPSFLKLIVERALADGADVSSVHRAMLSGEALPPSLRAWLHEHGVPEVFQLYGSADAGLIAYETAHEGHPLPGLLVDEGVLLEIVRPGTNQAVPPGEVGEVVVTVFNEDYPLIRFGTGDLSAIEPASLDAPSPCGRTNVRIRGWLGRADQSTKVRGMFVHPEQVAQVAARHPEIARMRLVLSGRVADEVMTLRCETAGAPRSGLADAVAATLRDVTKLRGAAEFVAAGGLPNDGIVIDDTRDYT